MIKVVAAAIIENNKVLITQRPIGKQLENLREFPGGKIEPGESKEDALIREIKEELDIDIKIDNFICESSYAYEFGEIVIYLYTATIANGKIKLIEHQNLAWVNKINIDNYDYPPIDEIFIKKLKEIL